MGDRGDLVVIHATDLVHLIGQVLYFLQRLGVKNVPVLHLQD